MNKGSTEDSYRSERNEPGKQASERSETSKQAGERSEPGEPLNEVCLLYYICFISILIPSQVKDLLTNLFPPIIVLALG